MNCHIHFFSTMPACPHFQCSMTGRPRPFQQYFVSTRVSSICFIFRKLDDLPWCTRFPFFFGYWFISIHLSINTFFIFSFLAWSKIAISDSLCFFWDYASNIYSSLSPLYITYCFASFLSQSWQCLFLSLDPPYIKCHMGSLPDSAAHLVILVIHLQKLLLNSKNHMGSLPGSTVLQLYQVLIN